MIRARCVGPCLRKAGLAVPDRRAGCGTSGRLLACSARKSTPSTASSRTAATTRSPTATTRSARSSSATRATCSRYLEAGEHSWNLFDHFWWNSGYVELAWGLFPIKPRGGYYGPFEASASAPTTLVVGTTYDPATPYRGATQARRRPGQHAFADDARRRSHGIRRQLRVHRRGGRRLPRGGDAARRGHRLPAGGGLRGAAASRAGARGEHRRVLEPAREAGGGSASARNASRPPPSARGGGRQLLNRTPIAAARACRRAAAASRGRRRGPRAAPGRSGARCRGRRAGARA